MEKKEKKISVAAVIDLGSNMLSMEIAQLMHGEIKSLESLSYPVSLGRDTFSAGYISQEKLNKTCEIIKKFLKEAESYGAMKIRAVATTAVREAKNRDFVLDQIKMRTGLAVRLLDDSAEKTLIYRDIIRRIKEIKTYKSPSLMVYLGVGNLGVSIYDKGLVPYTQNIRIGSLRLSEMLFNMQEYEEQYSVVIEDYLRGFMEVFNDTLPKGQLKHFIASGREIELIAGLCDGEITDKFVYIDKNSFLKLYDNLKNMTIDQIMEVYELQQDDADLVRSAMSIYHMLFRVTSANKIIAPLVFISDAVLYDLLCSKEAAQFNKNFEQNTLLSARNMARRYHYDQEHAEYVEKYSLKIFDKMKRYHGLDSRERLYLQVASITHDVGKYINITSHYNHSYDIIRNSEFVGLDMHETELIANIVKYHSSIVPNMLDYNFNRLNSKDQMLVSKLTAILRVAESLDKGHIKKFDDIDLKLKENTLIIGISTLRNTQIEEWSFAAKKRYFEEVYSMQAVIKKKRVI